MYPATPVLLGLQPFEERTESSPRSPHCRRIHWCTACNPGHELPLVTR